MKLVTTLIVGTITAIVGDVVFLVDHAEAAYLRKEAKHHTECPQCQYVDDDGSCSPKDCGECGTCDASTGDCESSPDCTLLEPRLLFSGEDLTEGPFHHSLMSHESCVEAGFRKASCEDIAWHADYVDSYNYNFLWWFQPFIKEVVKGNISNKTLADIDDSLSKDVANNVSIPVNLYHRLFDRFKAAKSIYPDLVKVHFDDVDSAEHVINVFNRYINGCLVGLNWAAEVYKEPSLAPGVDPIGAAHNLLGVALHAIQDFYGHSNWIDVPNRRQRTIHDVNVCELRNTFLYTGYYSTQSGVEPHGDYSIICSLLKGDHGYADTYLGGFPVAEIVSHIMSIYCSKLNPFADNRLCRIYNDCEKLVPISGAKVLNVTIPNHTVYVKPGINLDNTWLAEIGVQVRKIDKDLNGSEAFQIAKKLATSASIQFLQAVGVTVAEDMGYGDFWREVKTRVSSEKKENQYEKFNYFPFQFITTGPYPDFEDDNGYYLRVNLKTANDALAGTNADIKILVEDTEFSLDYMPDSNFIIGYNDFEAGDDTVYTIGPMASIPSQIVLKNDAPDVLDIVVQAGKDVIQTFINIGQSIIGWFTNDMDYVGTEGFLMEPSWLRDIAVGATKSKNRVRIDGGNQGKYRVLFDVTKISEDEVTAKATYKVKITRLVCEKESAGSGSDEPILMAVLAAFPGKRQPPFMKRFKRVDTGEKRTVNHSFQVITLPNHGAMVLTFRIWESDLESSATRRRALKEFLSEKNGTKEDTFLTKLGEYALADWKLDSIRVYAFHRGNSLKGGQVLYDNTDRWIQGGKSWTYPLKASGVKPIGTASQNSPAIVGSLVDIDFSEAADGQVVLSGKYVHSEWEPFGLSLSCEGGYCSRNGKYPRLFDTAKPSGKVRDLGAPNKRCDGGGPGRGEDGEPDGRGPNCSPLGNALIIQKDYKPWKFIDDNDGGSITFLFSGPGGKYIYSIGLLNVDGEASLEFTYENNSGASNKNMPIPVLGQNSYQTLEINKPHVREMKLVLARSGAVTSVKYRSHQKVTVGFNKTPDGKAVDRGSYVKNEWLPYGLSLSAEGGASLSNDNRPRIFDTSLPERDADLGAPNGACLEPGPGKGTGGEPGEAGANCKPLGNALIVQENNDSPSIPDDNAGGGNITLNFAKEGGQYVFDLDVLDIDDDGVVLLVTHDTPLGKSEDYEISVPNLGDNSHQAVAINATVTSVKVLLVRSGALTSVTFCL